jgi:hypothetical protein
MRFRLTPPGAPILFVSIILAATAVATFYTHVPVVGHYVATHRFWVIARRRDFRGTVGRDFASLSRSNQ